MSEFTPQEEFELSFSKLAEKGSKIANESLDNYLIRLFIEKNDETTNMRDNKIHLVQKQKYLTEKDIEEAVGYGADNGVCPCCGRSTYDYD